MDGVEGHRVPVLLVWSVIGFDVDVIVDTYCQPQKCVLSQTHYECKFVKQFEDFCLEIWAIINDLKKVTEIFTINKQNILKKVLVGIKLVNC